MVRPTRRSGSRRSKGGGRSWRSSCGLPRRRRPLVDVCLLASHQGHPRVVGGRCYLDMGAAIGDLCPTLASRPIFPCSLLYYQELELVLPA
jgi:hypothetical protein